MNDLRFGTIRELGERYRRREVSAVEVARIHLDAIAALQPRLNAFITIDPDPALAAAAEADRLLASGDDRPLLGVPVSIKDLIDWAGHPTTAGTRALEPVPAGEDAAVVERLQQAGAIILGKTNLHEIAFGATNENVHFGAVHNPWAEDRIPGGSSGGAGAAAAAGLSYASLGSDTGGSIRMPASLCGVSGIKPTFGLVSRHGVFPLSESLDHVGPLARSAEDCALVLAQIAGFDPRDPGSVDRPAPDVVAELGRPIAGLRLGRLRGGLLDAADTDVAACVDAAVQELAAQGAVIRDLEIQTFGDAAAINFLIAMAESAAVHAGSLRAHPEGYSRPILTRLRVGQLLPATAYVEARHAWRQFVAEIDEAMPEVDLLVLPASPLTAAPIGSATVSLAGREMEPAAALSRYSTAFNLTGMPAMSVPCGFDRRGLPVGLQIAARRWADATVLRLAAAYQAATDWHRRRPPGFAETTQSQRPATQAETMQEGF